jgi:hypothetical protein
MHVETRTTIAQMLLAPGAILNISEVLRSLDQCLHQRVGHAYKVFWEKDDLIRAEFEEGHFFLNVSFPEDEANGAALTIATSFTPVDCIASSVQAEQQSLIKDFLDAVAARLNVARVIWLETVLPPCDATIEFLAEELSLRLADTPSDSARETGPFLKSFSKPTLGEDVKRHLWHGINGFQGPFSQHGLT